MLSATGRSGVRKMRSRRWMNCCIRAIRTSLTRICRNTSTPFHIPSLWSEWLGGSSISTCCVEERDEKGNKRLTGGKDNDRGTPQGGVISPLLANLYMNRMLKGWRQTGRAEQFRARIVNYADDFVILSRGKAKEAVERTRGVLEGL